MNDLIIFLTLSLWSHHMGVDYCFNEIHSPIGIELKLKNKGVEILSFRNSNHKQSVLIAVNRQHKFFKVKLGIVTGYDYPVVPFIYPVPTYQIDDFQFELYVIPFDPGNVVIALSLKYQVN